MSNVTDKDLSKARDDMKFYTDQCFKTLSDRIEKLEQRTNFTMIDCLKCEGKAIAIKTYEPDPNLQPYHPRTWCEVYTCTVCETRYTLETEKVFKKV